MRTDLYDAAFLRSFEAGKLRRSLDSDGFQDAFRRFDLAALRPTIRVSVPNADLFEVSPEP